jgi:hypothetical protein
LLPGIDAAAAKVHYVVEEEEEYDQQRINTNYSDHKFYPKSDR